jgi:gliding motility-associated-like protein
MKPFFLSALLGLLLGLGPAGRVAAQCTINTPPCATPFVATDVATGQPVQALCVGRAVRFAPGCGRTVAANLLYYNALPGTNTTPANCDFTPGKLANDTFTPTAAGTTTISELANPSVAGGTGTVYVRNFRVYDSQPPTVVLHSCLSNTVGVEILGSASASDSYDAYFIQVNAGPLLGPLAKSSVTNVTAAPGSTIQVTGRYNDNAACTGTFVGIAPAQLPGRTVVPLLEQLVTSGPLPAAVSLTIGLNFQPGYIYTLEFADAQQPSNYRRVIDNILARTTLNTAAPAAGQFRLKRRDYCRTDSAYSPTLPTLELSGRSLNNVNTLSWRAGGPVASYTLLRNGTALATLPAGATSYADAAVSCGTSYTYRLQTSPVAGSTALSNEVAVQTTSALAPPPPLLNASFDIQNRLTLVASPASGGALPTGGQLRYSRQGGPGNLDFAAMPTATDTLRDPAPVAALLAAPPCYTVRLQDVCGNTSAASPPTCPSLLTVAAADPDGLTAQLSWSAFQGPGGAAGVRYRVLTLAPDGAVLAASPTLTGLRYLDANPPTDRQVLRYRVEASGGGLPAGTVSYSNVASLARQPTLAVPNAFTPNGDGLNDVLELKGRYLNGFTFVVIDRNGQEVFRATDRSQTWDGTIRGHAPVNAAYVWRFTLRDETGQDISQTGTVTILK